MVEGPADRSDFFHSQLPINHMIWMLSLELPEAVSVQYLV